MSVQDSKVLFGLVDLLTGADLAEVSFTNAFKAVCHLHFSYGMNEIRWADL